MAAPSSAKANAPNRESRAPTIQAAKTTDTERPSRAISAGFRKMPVPTMVPTTIAAEAQGPRPRTSSRRFSGGGVMADECRSFWDGGKIEEGDKRKRRSEGVKAL